MVWVQLEAELSAACVFLGTLIATGSAGGDREGVWALTPGPNLRCLVCIFTFQPTDFGAGPELSPPGNWSSLVTVTVRCPCQAWAARETSGWTCVEMWVVGSLVTPGQAGHG